MNYEIQDVRDAVATMMFGDKYANMDPTECEQYDIGVMLLSALIVGTDVKALIEFTELDEGDVCVYAQQAIDQGIFIDDKVNAGWMDEETGTISFLCDVLAVQGMLTRVNEETTDVDD